MFFKRFHRIFLAYLWNEHEGIFAYHFALYRAKSLSKEPFNAVSLYAFAVFFTDRNSHRHFLSRGIHERQRRGKRPFSFLEQFLKIWLFFQSYVFHKLVPLTANGNRLISNIYFSPYTGDTLVVTLAVCDQTARNCDEEMRRIYNTTICIKNRRYSNRRFYLLISE